MSVEEVSDDGNVKPARRYQIESGPPPWTWDEYRTWLDAAWRELLINTDPKDERPFQKFLESHPSLIPGGEGSGESFGGHHGGWRQTVITQPPLPGIRKRIPDFMWLTKNSEDIIPVLIEIEAPGKPWFNADGTRSAKLTQAQDQLAEWRQALDNEANRLQLGEMYDFPRRWTLTFNLVPRYLLIYGRRHEFDKRPDLNQKRRMIRGEATEIMTYDRLEPLSGSSNAISVRMEKNKGIVVAVPPTFRLGPDVAERVARLEGWEAAIEANQLMSDDRKTFLLSRLPYWSGLGQDGQSLGIRGSKDWE